VLEIVIILNDQKYFRKLKHSDDKKIIYNTDLIFWSTWVSKILERIRAEINNNEKLNCFIKK